MNRIPIVIPVVSVLQECWQLRKGCVGDSGDVDYEEELYTAGNMVIWSQGSRNQASSVYKAFTVDSLVQQVGLLNPEWAWHIVNTLQSVIQIVFRDYQLINVFILTRPYGATLVSHQRIRMVSKEHLLENTSMPDNTRFWPTRHSRAARLTYWLAFLRFSYWAIILMMGHVNKHNVSLSSSRTEHDVEEQTVCIVQSTCVNVHSVSGKDFISPLPFQVRTWLSCSPAYSFVGLCGWLKLGVGSAAYVEGNYSSFTQLVTLWYSPGSAYCLHKQL